MERQPQSVSMLQPMSPKILDRTIHKALAKAPDERWQDVGDFRTQLIWARDGAVGESPASASPQGRRRDITLAALALLTGGILVGLFAWQRTEPVLRPITRATLDLPPGRALVSRASRSIALSPDGSLLVLALEEEGTSRLFRRQLSQYEAQPISGTEGAHTPFFSPDGQWIGFFTEDSLKKVSIGGGAPVSIADVAPFATRGASWAKDDTIVFGRVAGPLMAVSASGGTLSELTTLDDANGEAGHRWPHILPDDDGVLFTVRTRGGWSAAALSRETRRVRRFPSLGTALPAGFVQSGHLLYTQNGVLLAAPFDFHELDIEGPSLTVIDDTHTTGLGVPQMALGSNGTLVYAPTVPGGGTPVWVDRAGDITTINRELVQLEFPRISPDGQEALFGSTASPGIWLYELERGTRTRLSGGVEGIGAAVWISDGEGVTFTTAASGSDDSSRGMVSRARDGIGELELLFNVTGGARVFPGSWSSDGTLVYTQTSPATPVKQIWAWSPGRDPTPILSSSSNDTPHISPDGRWLAYVSDESGRREVYAQPFPELNQREQLSTNGGSEPVWSRDGRELFYREADTDSLMAVSVSTSGQLAAGKPRRLFDASRFRASDRDANYDVAPDGRFLMIETPLDSKAPNLRVVLNWLEELEQLVPTQK